MTMGDGQKVTWSGTRAPSLRRAGRPAWGEPVTLFNGKSLDGWQPLGRGDSQWSAAGGVLQNAKSGANLVTVGKFDDFKLHLEFRVPKGANSGVYLRGRYELQIDDATGLEPSSHHLGGVYGFIAPSENVARAAGEWQSMDVTLVGRMLTYELNGTADHLQPGDSGNHRRRARQRRSGARAAAAPGRSRSRGLPQHRDHTGEKVADGEVPWQKFGNPTSRKSFGGIQLYNGAHPIK